MHRPIGGSDATLKRTQPNSKYANVKSRVDTGASVNKVERWWEEASRGARIRPDETFRRLTAPVLEALLANQQHGIEVMILDVRPDDADWAECHIVGSAWYPHTRLHHSTAPFSQELLAFRGAGQGDRIIVLYDADERWAPPAAELMFQKGFDNVFVLTGGLPRAAAKCPGIVEGMLPHEDAAQAAATQRRGDRPIPAKPTGERAMPSGPAAVPSPLLPAPRGSPGAAAHAMSPVRYGGGEEPMGGGVAEYEGPVSPVKRSEAAGRGARSHAPPASTRGGRELDLESILSGTSAVSKTGAARGTAAARYFKQKRDNLRKAAGAPAPAFR
ncbi:unnamed protein product [Pedinophyceae sp. YPF-701]|nr:unnamed protein product [Pedinophyceae sp. YPF-701]